MIPVIKEILTIDGFGDIMADSVTEYFGLEQSKQLILELKEKGLNMSSLKEYADGRFEGLTFVLTGTLPTYSRNEASEIIESFKGKVSSSVSAKWVIKPRSLYTWETRYSSA